MLYFNRKAKLNIGQEGQTAREYDGFTLDFQVNKDASATENTALIRIFNLSPQSRAHFEQADNIVELFAGYEDNVKMIFKGDVIELGATHQKNGSDWVTTVKANDGGTKLLQTKIAVPFAADTKYSTVLNKLVETLGYTTEGLRSIPDNIKFKNGYVASGFVKDNLNLLAQMADMQWSIQDDSLVFMPQNEATNDTAVVINKKHGLISSPIKSDKGLQVISLLNPELKIGRFIELESELLEKKGQGLYKVNKLIHKGNSREGDFYSIMQVEEIS